MRQTIPARFLFNQPDATALTSQGYNTIKYVCDNPGDPLLLVWFYPQKNYQDPQSDYAGTQVVTVACGSTTGISGQSFAKLPFRPAAFIFSARRAAAATNRPDLMATKIPSQAPSKTTSNRCKLSTSLSPSDKLKIISDYGVILHTTQNPNHSGTCSAPLFAEPGQKQACFNISAIQAETQPPSLTSSTTQKQPPRLPHYLATARYSIANPGDGKADHMWARTTKLSPPSRTPKIMATKFPKHKPIKIQLR